MKRNHQVTRANHEVLGRWITRASALCMLCGVAVLLQLGPFAAKSASVSLEDSSGNESGWVAWFDSSLDPFVDIVTLEVDPSQDAVFIHKSADFRQPAVNGVFPTIPIVFVQMDPNAVSNIVIDDEIIFNNTGADWTEFHMNVMDHGDVEFDAVSTANSGGTGPIGFSISPFSQAQFVTDSNGLLASLYISGGTVADGTPWFPGSGASDGQVWISVNTAPGNTVFTLLERPGGVTVVPLPTSAWLGIALLGGGGILGAIRRRLGRNKFS